MLCKGGFDPQRRGETTGKLFGVASYFAAHASKGDVYTEERASPLPRGTSRTLIVAQANRATRPMRDATRPPDGADGLALDSVWADERERREEERRRKEKSIPSETSKSSWCF